MPPGLTSYPLIMANELSWGGLWDYQRVSGGLGEQYSEVAEGSFILRRKEKVFSRQNNWFPLQM